MSGVSEFLVLRLLVDSEVIDALLAPNNEVERLDMEARISRQLTGDDNAYEGLLISREAIDMKCNDPAHTESDHHRSWCRPKVR